MAVMYGTEVAKHSTEKDCWVVINGKIWDVSDFLVEHPGGAGVIAKYAGRDATKAYSEAHGAELVKSMLPASNYMGEVFPGSIEKLRHDATATTTNKPAKSARPLLHSVINIDDFEVVAKGYLSPTSWAYYAGGAEDEVSLMDTRRLFRIITFRPRVLRPVEPVSPAVKVLGYPSSLPLYISPTGLGRYAYPNAESVLAHAAGKEGVIYCMPTTSAHESVFAARSMANQPLFFQLYTTRDRAKAQAMIKKLELLGAKALFVTVDSPVIGRREADERIKVADGVEVSSGGVAKAGSMGLLNPMLGWEDLKWIRAATSMPVVLKGVQTVEDAALAYDLGVQGIVLSNHGGRSLDGAQAPILTLLEIRRYAPHLLLPSIRDKFQVFVDGGFRRGTDILKALALGASAVGIGRPFLYSMTAEYGEAGVRRLLQLFRVEIETSMALAGATTVEQLVPEMVNSERAESEVSRRIKL
ncbi:glycolate oxidase [Xylaria bambusicola]|uniref:glycolate oxidase n=1 Tax=Xylaria bambusicola TaxID=326684 RepID=UPI0020075534|nr:glycolate oxidase [Xylaria bambusicola]KAI0506034.1 glycolate oxidase [Xylaria bambusicola]